MPDRPKEKVTQVVQCSAVLAVEDVEKTCAFYRERLGFEQSYGGENYGVVFRENGAVHFKKESPPDRVELFFWVEDVDSLHSEFAKAGVDAPEPVTQPYEIREFTMLDPNGIALRFGQDAY